MLPEIKLSEYNKIHKDYRGVWSRLSEPQYIDKRTMMSNILIKDSCCCLLIEDYHFKIVNG
jgi:hypothetical protein